MANFSTAGSNIDAGNGGQQIKGSAAIKADGRRDEQARAAARDPRCRPPVRARLWMPKRAQTVTQKDMAIIANNFDRFCYCVI